MANALAVSLYDGRQELAQYAQNTHIANDDNAWFHQWINRGWRGRYNNHPTLSSEQSTGNTEGELEAYRKLTYLPEQVAGVYGQLLSQELYGSTRAEFKFGYNGHGYAWGYINNRNQKHFASKLYFSQDAQNSTIKVTGENNEHSYRYAYTPFGQAYGFSDRRTNQWRNEFYAKDYLNAHVVPYLYTGKYTDPVTGLANMDARWYDAKTGRFVQADQYNHANLMLPRGAQSELMRYIGRSQGDLLRDPAQQMRYGYVSGNVLSWMDPLGLEAYPWDNAVYGASFNDATRPNLISIVVTHIEKNYGPSNDPYVNTLHSEDGRKFVDDVSDASLVLLSDPNFQIATGVTITSALVQPELILAGVYSMSTAASNALTDNTLAQHAASLIIDDPSLIEAVGVIEGLYGTGSSALGTVDLTVDILTGVNKAGVFANTVYFGAMANDIVSTGTEYINMLNNGRETQDQCLAPIL